MQIWFWLLSTRPTTLHYKVKSKVHRQVSAPLSPVIREARLTWTNSRLHCLSSCQSNSLPLSSCSFSLCPLFWFGFIRFFCCSVQQHNTTHSMSFSFSSYSTAVVSIKTPNNNNNKKLDFVAAFGLRRPSWTVFVLSYNISLVYSVWKYSVKSLKQVRG